MVALFWLCCVILGKDNCLLSRKLVSNVTDFFTRRWYFFGRRFFFWQSHRLIYTVNLHTNVFEEILAIVFRYILQISLFARNDSNTNTVNNTWSTSVWKTEYDIKTCYIVGPSFVYVTDFLLSSKVSLIKTSFFSLLPACISSTKFTFKWWIKKWRRY